MKEPLDMNRILLITLVLVTWAGVAGAQPMGQPPGTTSKQGGTREKSDLPVATFAGGCFWCTEHDFGKPRGW